MRSVKIGGWYGGDCQRMCGMFLLSCLARFQQCLQPILTLPPYMLLQQFLIRNPMILGVYVREPVVLITVRYFRSTSNIHRNSNSFAWLFYFFQREFLPTNLAVRYVYWVIRLIISDTIQCTIAHMANKYNRYRCLG